MKPFLFVVTFFLTTNSAFSQEFKLWADLKPGKFNVGFQDTVIRKADEAYSYKNYSGAKPFFISIWFPLKEIRKETPMTYQEYYNSDHQADLDSVRNTMIETDKAVFIESGITSNIDTWGKLEFAENEKKLFQAIFNTKVRAYRTTHFPNTKYPTIIYHHGGGGTAEENAVLFEFLASYGFVVISCNYKFPTEDVENYFQIDSTGIPKFYPIPDKEITDIEFTIQFAKSLPFTDPDNFNFIGHSRGAQDGLMLNQKGNDTIKKYILFDTSLEDYQLEAIKQMWPDWYSLIREHAEYFKTKTYMISAPRAYYEADQYLQQPNPEFQIFKFLNPETFTLLHAKQPMNHNSFLSLGIIKKLFTNEFKQVDNRTASDQVNAYFSLVRLTLSILKDEAIDQNKFTFVK